MSLVNDMLRDLDRRERMPVSMRRVGVTYQEERRTSSAVVGGIVALCILAGFAGGYLFFYKDKADSIPVAAQLELAAPVLAPASALVPEGQQAGKLGVQMSIAEEAVTGNGFSLRLSASEKVDYEVLERNSYSLKLQLKGVEQYSRSESIPGGVSIMQTPNATLVEFELNDPADFQVYEDAATDGFDIVMSASYRDVAKNLPAENSLPQRAVTEMPEHGAALTSMQQEMSSSSGNSLMTNKQPAPTTAIAEPSHMQPSAQARVQSGANEKADAPVRINRELSSEQKDRNASQKALALIQQGKIYDSYELLLTYLAKNPDAHNSRETLATVLLAQQELPQARVVIEEGLKITPNYAPFKKIMARVLLQSGEITEAKQLLTNLPPALASDPEYFDLLASLYQQSNQHELAVSTYQALLRTDPQQGRWWAAMAISLEALGKITDAKDSFQQALQTASLNVELRQYSQKRLQSLNPQQ